MLIKIQKLHNKFILKTKYHEDDTFLVSYPKSGNTWVRFLIANLMVNGKVEINFHNAVDYIPDIDAHKKIANELNPPRIVKSHQPFNKKFARVLYIIRDPRDVYVSYFFYLQKKLPKEHQDINSFIKNINQYNISWEDHVQSWMKNLSVEHMFVRYEDLKLNPFEKLKEISTFCNLQTDDSLLKSSIEKSSFNSMSKIEDEKGRPFTNEEDAKKSTKFVRSGKSGGWKEHLDLDIQQYIEKKCGDMMQKFGYL